MLWEPYRYFLAVAETGSLSAAARQLSVSQPTVGRQITELETRLNTRLFDRASHGYFLTRAGEAIQNQISVIETSFLEVEKTVSGLDQALSGEVSISATEGLGSGWLVSAIKEFQDLHPAITFNLMLDISVIDLVRGKADIALRLANPADPELIGRKVGEVGFGLYGAEKYFEEHGVPPLPADVELPREIAVGFEKQREVIELLFERKISLMASALGPPPSWMIEMGREKGVKVAALAGTVEHARRHVEAGVDIVVAQGYEAGGHTGQVATMVLVPEVVDAVDPVPVLAAGGIGNGRQVAASLALGAQGVWTGSVWLTTEEAETHPVVKQKFLEATSSDTVRSRSLTGKPARQLRCAWTDAWDDPTNPDPLPMPLQPRLVRDAQARIARTAHKSEGAKALSNYFVGQIVGSMNHVKSVRSVVEELVTEYADTMVRLDEWADG